MESKVAPGGDAVITIGDKNIKLPILKGTVGPDVVDIRKLYGEADVFTYDPAFTSTASCESQITYIDGDAGILLYRGYPIEQLAENSSFLEVCYLLLNGELPTASEFAEFERTRIAERMEDGRRGKKARGGHIGGTAPYGYRVVGAGREAMLERVPEEERIALRAAALRANGLSLRAVGERLEAEGFRPRIGDRWHAETVRKVLVAGTSRTTLTDHG